MATFLKLLLFGCICLSACTQQNRGVRSADELFKELEIAYQKKDSVAFEKFFKEWNEISIDSLNSQKLDNDTIREVYNIMKDLNNPPTTGIVDRKYIKNYMRHGVVQTSIPYSMRDSIRGKFLKDTLHNFYAETQKGQDSILYNFPEYNKAIELFLFQHRNDTGGLNLPRWIYLHFFFGLVYDRFYEIEFINDLQTATLWHAKSHLDLVLRKNLKKINGHWIETDENFK